MATLDYKKIYALQDEVLAAIFSVETTFYLTGGSCLNRFYYHRRYSDDLDLFTNENTIYRDDIRILLDTLDSTSLAYTIQTDTRDFIQLMIHDTLQLNLVNDRVYRYGKSVHSPDGIVLDNEINICANKLCGIIGRDDPKDMFDLYSIYKNGKVDWKIVFSAVTKKRVLEPEVLEYRLSSFPLDLLDLLAVVDPATVTEMKQGCSSMVEHILDIMP
jgi:predicted nucleotidyltransferase component of viral defense system